MQRVSDKAYSRKLALEEAHNYTWIVRARLCFACLLRAAGRDLIHEWIVIHCGAITSTAGKGWLPLGTLILGKHSFRCCGLLETLPSWVRVQILAPSYINANSTSDVPSLSKALKRRAGILVIGNLHRHADPITTAQPAETVSRSRPTFRAKLREPTLAAIR